MKHSSTRRTAYCFSDGITKAPYWRQLLDVGQARVIGRRKPRGQNGELLVDWGNKRREKALALQQKTGLPLLRLEDGFIRSLGLGVEGSVPYSLVVDDIGIYYDANQASRLECLLNGDVIPPSGIAALDKPSLPLQDPALLVRARRCIDLICQHGISKYNNLPDRVLGAKSRRRLLLVDQTAGDLSVSGGLASADSFQKMLEDALNESDSPEIIIKTHPDVVAGKKQGYLAPQQVTDNNVTDNNVTDNNRLHWVAEAVNPYALLKQVDEVWVVTSQLGFEGLLAGVPVRCYGAPFYAGWGLTEDKLELPRRNKQRSLEQLFAAAYLDYSRYFDPDTGEPCEFEVLLEFMIRQRNLYRENAGQLLCYGFPPWRRAYMRAYLASPWNSVDFVNDPEKLLAAATPQHRVLVWGNTLAEQWRRQLQPIPVWRVEDAFIRSVGLGKYYVPPLSLVIDKSGIYYDPRQPSDLEVLLSNAEFSKAELERSRRLIDTLLEQKLTKYNVGSEAFPVLHKKPGQRVILVPGQVESDASIAAGCVDICTDRELLEAVREARPHAFIVYKPHPDVVSGNESGDFVVNAELADLTVTEVGIDDCLAEADEVHTLTSLAGFEALLRGKQVVTYGLPFYAGWGLTWDRHPLARRQRQLTLEQLVAGVMIRYPRYLNLDKRHFTTPEFAIQVLVDQRNRQKQQAVSATRWRRLVRKVLNLARSLHYGWRQSL